VRIFGPERFDKPYADLLDTQDEVAARLGRTIHVELIAAESRRAGREHADRFDSLDHTLNGWAAWNQPLSLEGARKARGFLRQRSGSTKHNVSALLGIANAHMWEVNMYVSDDREAQIRAAEAGAAKALAMNPNTVDVHVTRGTVLIAMRAPERALREFELAVSLDGNLALAHGYLGLMKFFLGRARETRPHISEADAAQPRDPLLFHWHFLIGVADLYLGRGAARSRAFANRSKSIRTGRSPNSSSPAPWRSRGGSQKPPRLVPLPSPFAQPSPSPSSAPKL